MEKPKIFQIVLLGVFSVFILIGLLVVWGGRAGANRFGDRKAFRYAVRWLSIVGTEGMETWRTDGSLLFPDGAGVLRRVHWGFYEEGSKLPGRPDVPCPTRIYHGIRDATVPVTTSRSYVSTRPHVELIEVDDEHRLTDSIDVITSGTLSFFGID